MKGLLEASQMRY